MQISIIKGFPHRNEIKGLVVMIDVFRTSSTLTCLSMLPFKKIILEDSVTNLGKSNNKIEDVYYMMDKEHKLRDKDNSPVAALNINYESISNITVISQNGTQVKRIISLADELIYASFLNLKFAANYILSKSPKFVTLIAIGNINVPEETFEDNLCAESLQKLILGEKLDYDLLNQRLLEIVDLLKDDIKSPQGLNIDIDRLFSTSFNIFNTVPQVKVINGKITVTPI